MTNAYDPGSQFKLRSPYGPRIDPMTGTPGKFHSGLDFAARAGTPIPAAASGEVVYSGYNTNLGNVVIIRSDAGGYSLYGHMQGANQPGVGQRIWQGDTIGLVGSTGARTTGNHLHYSIITDQAGAKITGASTDGSIGIPLNETNTKGPAQYDNYDPTPRYLDETRRAAQIVSGTNAGATSGGRSPDPSASFVDRFGNWTSSGDGFIPRNPDQPAPLPQAGGVPGPVDGRPARRLGRFVVGGPQPSVFDTGAPAVPSFPPNDAFSPDRPASLNDRFGDWTASPEGGISPRNPGPPVSPPEAGRPLGIVSGQPMPQWITPPPIFGQPDRSKLPVDEGKDWLMRLIRSVGSY